MNTEQRVLETLETLQADLARLADRMTDVGVEMRATRQHVAGLVAVQDHDHVELAQVKRRLDRIERQLRAKR
nr:hypothetical protein [Hyphomonas sp. Mor2]